MEGAAPSRATVASNGEVQRLTDYEVLRFLQLRRQVRDSSGGRDVHAALVAAGGLSALSGSGTNVMNQKEVILNRIGEVKWISKMAQRYLMGTPAALQTRDGIAQALDALRADNKDDIGSSLRLSESKKLSLINANAGSHLLASVCLGERLPLRPRATLGEYDHAAVASRIAAALPMKAVDVAAAHAQAVAKAQAAVAAASDAAHTAAPGEDQAAADAALAEARAVAAAVAADVPPAVHEWKLRAREHRDGRDGRDGRDHHGRDREFGHGSRFASGGAGYGGGGHGAHGGPSGGHFGPGSGSSGKPAHAAHAAGQGHAGARSSSASAPAAAAPVDPLALPAFLDTPSTGLTELLVEAPHASGAATSAAAPAAGGGAGVEVGQKRKRGASAAAPAEAGVAGSEASAAAEVAEDGPAAGARGRGRGRK